MVERPSPGPLRNVSTRRIVRALEQDGFAHTERQGSSESTAIPMAGGLSFMITGRRIRCHPTCSEIFGDVGFAEIGRMLRLSELLSIARESH